MSDTIFYDIKLKKNRTVSDVFIKIQKFVKPKGATKNWECFVGKNELVIDFHDDKSETFCLAFEKKEARGFCKVWFPLGGELFDNDKKSEFKALISMLHSFKNYCTEMSITDDYEIAEEIFRSLDYKFKLRELTDEESSRVRRLYDLGYTRCEDLLLAIVAEDLGMPEDFRWKEYVFSHYLLLTEPEISRIFETYLCELAIYKKKPLMEQPQYQTALKEKKPVYHSPCMAPADVYTYTLGIKDVFEPFQYIINEWGRGAQVSKYLNDSFLPVFRQCKEFGKCELAYRFMVSLADFCGFTFIDKGRTPRKAYDPAYRWLYNKIPVHPNDFRHPKYL